MLLSWIPLALLLFASCDHGLVPPDTPPVGSIQGTITYVDTDTWPPLDSLVDLRFVALPFIPQDTLDFFRDLNSLVFSERLQYYVAADSFRIDSVDARAYVYSGVAQQFTTNLLSWRPVGLYEENGGVFEVRPNEVTEVNVTVDFRNIPPFPPSVDAQ